MRRLQRVALPKAAASYLTRRQTAANLKRQQRQLDITADWKSARQTKAMGSVLSTLQSMVGARQRCMYCLDSHGSDIEHFRPKANFPGRMYHWPTLLLCCAECGRFKGNQFPVAGRRTLLVDPTKENPWDHLDFDPVTGNICARFDLKSGTWSTKGEKTVEVLQLDRREALSAGYLQTLRRLSNEVQVDLAGGAVDASKLVARLKPEDDHGLLAWCFGDRGKTHQPFSDLHQKYPTVWRRCCRALKA
jgi:uncharacterized protein (TIGR02646 family)